MDQQKTTLFEIFAEYLRALRNSPLGEKTEFMDRAPLERLLNAFGAQAEGRPRIQHEPKRIAGKGAPDFKVTASGMVLGYVETKAIGEDLGAVIKSRQFERYQLLSSNFLLTDYLRWVWVKDGRASKPEMLCSESDLANKKATLRPERIEAIAKLISSFLSIPPEGIGAVELALLLAGRAHLLREFLGDELKRQEIEQQGEKLYGLYEAFRKQVSHELTLGDFSDTYAQMLAYGIFLPG